MKAQKGHPLSRREKQVVALVREGCCNKEIGERLGLTVGTVKVYMYHVFIKTGLASRLQVALSKDLLDAAA